MKKSISFFVILNLVFTFIWAQAKIQLKASCEMYFNDEYEPQPAPSSDGIYPVKLTVTTKSADKTLYVKIYRAEKRTGPFTLVIDTMQGNEEYFDLYDSTPAKPGQKYYYTAVLGKYTLETAPQDCISNNVCGWGALTHEAFYVFFNNTMIKSYKKMTLMNKPGGLAKLGHEETRGDVSGEFIYDAKVKGMGGVAVMSYKNYSDDNIVFYDGDMITNADMLASGTMDGYVKMSGMYNGTVYFDKVKVKNSQVCDGTYKIKLAGSNTKEISYTWNLVNY